MTSWRTITLGQLVSFQRGHDLPSEEREDGNVPVMGSFGITGWHSVSRAHGPGVTVGRSGASIGVVSYIDRDYWPLNTCLFSTNFHGNNPRFIYYFLQTLNLAAHNSGSAQPSLNRNYIAPIKIKVPDRRGQDQIVELLGSLDDKIELNRRMNEILEAMAQANFRDWFVDFGPTRRKIEGATDPVRIMGALAPDGERARHLADLFPGSIGDDGLPEGWTETTVSSLIDFNPSEPMRRGTVAPYTEMGSLPTAGSLAEPPIDREFNSGMRFRNGDALIARITPSLENGKAAFVDFLPDAASVGWGSTEFIVLRARPPVPPPFAYLLVRHPEFRERAIRSMTGTSGRQRAQADDVSRFPIARPIPDVFTAFKKLVQPCFDLISEKGRENRTLAATRDLLLPKLMSGQIRLGEVEAIAEAAE